MRNTTPAEYIEMLKTAIAFLCYFALLAGFAWYISVTAEMIRQALKRRKLKKAAETERKRLEAWKKYNERREMLNDPDYYGEI